MSKGRSPLRGLLPTSATAVCVSARGLTQSVVLTPPPPLQRKCFTAVTRTLGSAQLSTAAAICLPPLYLIVILIVGSSSSSSSSYSSAITTSYYFLRPFLAAITAMALLGMVLSLTAVYWKWQNVLWVGTQLYDGIGKWCLMSSALLLLSGFAYTSSSYNLSMQFLSVLWLAIAPPAFIFLFCSSVMDQHRALLVREVDSANSPHPMAQQEVS